MPGLAFCYIHSLLCLVDNYAQRPCQSAVPPAMPIPDISRLIREATDSFLLRVAKGLDSIATARIATIPKEGLG